VSVSALPEVTGHVTFISISCTVSQRKSTTIENVYEEIKLNAFNFQQNSSVNAVIQKSTTRFEKGKPWNGSRGCRRLIPFKQKHRRMVNKSQRKKKESLHDPSYRSSWDTPKLL
jgi:hypothetical protein